MQQRLARQGFQSFVHDTVAPLTRRVGEAWEDGSFEVFEENRFTELTKRRLRQAIAALPGGVRSPRILLTKMCIRDRARPEMPEPTTAMRCLCMVISPLRPVYGLTRNGPA